MVDHEAAARRVEAGREPGCGASGGSRGVTMRTAEPNVLLESETCPGDVALPFATGSWLGRTAVVCLEPRPVNILCAPYRIRQSIGCRPISFSGEHHQGKRLIVGVSQTGWFLVPRFHKTSWLLLNGEPPGGRR